MSFKVAPASTESIGFGEGPLWDDRINKLICVDAFGKAIIQFDPKTKQSVRKITNTSEKIPYINVAVPYATNTETDKTSSPNYLVAATDNLYKFNWETEESTILYEFETTFDGKKRYFHDAKCDPSGRLWIGSLVLNDNIGLDHLDVVKDEGGIHRFESIGNKLSETTHASGYNLPNGLAWNKEYTKLFCVDFMKRVINVYDFDKQEGQLGNGRIFFDFASKEDLKGLPDGMCADVSGNLWIACWKGGSVIKIDGNTGQLIEIVKLPVENTTSVCFGGDNYESLFVTTSSMELDQSEVKGQPDAGKIMRITNEKDNSFKGFQHYFFNN